MVTKYYDDPRVVRFDMTRVYAALVGTALWVIVCGLLMAVYLQNPRTGSESWRAVTAFGLVAAIVPVTAYKNHPHAWPTLYTVIGLMLMYASMIAR
jgi:peptidoglycan/LPS O-acetylase OafA/YrhL